MKKLLTAILFCMLIISLSACSSENKCSESSQILNEDDNKNITISSNNQEQQTNKQNIDTNNQPATQSVHVIKSFFAVEGAVIYDQTYDEYGYPNCCYFHNKCEACGDISNSNGSARGNLTTSYYCPKCKSSNHVEIKADSEWIEVND